MKERGSSERRTLECRAKVLASANIHILELKTLVFSVSRKIWWQRRDTLRWLFQVSSVVRRKFCPSTLVVSVVLWNLLWNRSVSSRLTRFEKEIASRPCVGYCKIAFASVKEQFLPRVRHAAVPCLTREATEPHRRHFCISLNSLPWINSYQRYRIILDGLV